MTELTLHGASKLVGVTYPVLNRWIKAGLVPLAGESPRRVGMLGLVIAEVLARLERADAGADVMARAAAAVKDNWRNGWPNDAGYLLVMSDSVRWSLGPGSLLGHAVREFRRPMVWCQVMLIDLKELAWEAEAKLAAEPEPQPATVLELDAQREETAEKASSAEED